MFSDKVAKIIKHLVVAGFIGVVKNQVRRAGSDCRGSSVTDGVLTEALLDRVQSVNLSATVEDGFSGGCGLKPSDVLMST